MNRRFFISSAIAVGGAALLSRMPALSQMPSWAQSSDRESLSAQDKSKSTGLKKVNKTDAEWKSQLTPEQYDVLRKKGTEYAFTSPLTDIHDKGVFQCAGCELPVFNSAQKFDSGTGWPSFWAPIKKENVVETEDRS